MTENLNLLTLVIPTYNRPDYLERLLTFFSKLNFSSKIIISDSSKDFNKNLNNSTIKKFDNLEIELLSFSNETYFYEKLKNSLDKVQTKYVVFCADDDFLIPNSISMCLNFFENNQGYSIVHGTYYTFRLNQHHLEWIKTYKTTSLIDNDQLNRIDFHLRNYETSTLYGIHKTNDLKYIFDQTLQYTEDLRFGELFSSLLTIMIGRMKFLDVPYSIRESLKTSDNITHEHFIDYIEKGTYEAKFNKFKEGLKNNFDKKYEINNLNQIIDTNMNYYITTISRNQKGKSNKLNNIIEFLFRKIDPSAHITRKRQLLSYLKNPIKYKEQIKSIESELVKIKEIKLIQDLIL